MVSVMGVSFMKGAMTGSLISKPPVDEGTVS